MTLKWSQHDQSDSHVTMIFYRLLSTCWWLVILVLFIWYEFSIVWRPILLLLMFHITAPQLFINCWVRATASIVRAKRFYSDDIWNSFRTYSLLLFMICASFFFMSSFVLLFLLLFIFSSQTSSFGLQSETALPVHCQDRFMKNDEKPKENKGFFDFWGPEMEKDLNWP